jgi:phage shock protein PspC (stress-responsive transcriptional regulator)
MKKVININLGSIVFAIEQDAYEALSVYLTEIKTNLASTADAGEVIADVERAIAEKFFALKRSEKSAVTSADVERVMSEMGSPADFAEGESTTNESADAAAEPAVSQTDAKDPKRRLYRDTDDSVVAGVASGLAQYFEIDPVIVRLIFVVSVFFSGLGILSYIILWLVVPAATTTTDKYAMRGERVTLKDISERVKKNIDNINDKDLEKAKGVWAKMRSLLDVCFSVIGKLFRVLAKVARFVGGLVLVIAGALGIAGLVSLYSVILLSDKVFFPVDVQTALETLQGSAIGIVAMFSSFIMMTIPLMVLVIAGASLLAKRNYFTVQKSVALAVVWIVAAVVAGTTSALQAEQVMQKIGPIEGRFDDSSFEVRWEGGRIYGDEHYFNYVPTPSNPPSQPERMTITGTYDCLEDSVVIDSPSESCIQGLRTSEGELYAIDLMLMSQIPPVLEPGDTITISGPFIPAEQMSASWWHDSNVEGLLSASSVREEESGYNQLPVNDNPVEDDVFLTPPIEEEVKSAPPSSEPMDLPVSN